MITSSQLSALLAANSPIPVTQMNVTMGLTLLTILALKIRSVRKFPKTLKLEELYVYPVKGCKGISMENVRVLRRGFFIDRRFMVVDETGTFLSQRTFPKLALIVPQVSADGKTLTLFTTTLGDRKDVSVSNFTHADKQRVNVRVWNSHVEEAIDQGEAASAFLTNFLMSPNAPETFRARLVFMPVEAKRECNPNVAPGCPVSFADGYPMLLTSQSSLADLNKRINGEIIPMNRFRPNIVVSGLLPWMEDLVGTRLRCTCPAGSTTTSTSTSETSDARERVFYLRFVKPCDRCKVPTICQQTGLTLTEEPTKTLKTFRQLKGTVDVYFGMNVVLEEEDDEEEDDEEEAGGSEEDDEESPERAPILSVGDTCEVIWP